MNFSDINFRDSHIAGLVYDNGILYVDLYYPDEKRFRLVFSDVIGIDAVNLEDTILNSGKIDNADPYFAKTCLTTDAPSSQFQCFIIQATVNDRPTLRVVASAYSFATVK